MKKINIIVLLFTLLAGTAFGQTAYNPFTQNIHFEPEPTTAGFGCNTVQKVVFTQGLTTQDDATQWQTNPLTVVICLTGFTFNGPASTAVTGTYASNFSWEYDSFAPNCVIGTQIAPLPGTGTDIFNPNPAATGDIEVSLLVPETSPISTILAVNVNLQVPGYMSSFNSTPDDNESTQTQTFCALKIRGNVFYDNNGDNNVNGTPIQHPNGVQLHANLLNSAGVVIATMPIGTDGKYEFNNINPDATYSVSLSINPGTVGVTAPPSDLPPTWVNVGEDCCDNIGTDGNPNGSISVPVQKASKVEINFGIFSPTPLPVKLNYFFATENNCAGLLSWSTEQEINAAYVEVLRKDNANGEFKKIATVQAAGNSNSTKLYNYLDKDVAEQDEAYQYQLHFVDLDQKDSYSEIRSLKLNCAKGNTSINVFPNPTLGEINILYVTDAIDEMLQYEVVDLTGRKIISDSKLLVSGSNLITLDLTSFATGTYFVKYHEVDGGKDGSIKILKK